jgi:protein-S-isoprenylcysteine O-methyltransferase Ste14
MSKMDPADNPGVIAFPPLIWLVNTVISVLVHMFVQLPITRYGVCLVCGIIFVSLAPTLALSAMRTMKAAGTNILPSEPALTIVRDGPFRFTPNPVYLSFCLLQIALGFFLNDWITLLFVIPLGVIFHYGVVLRERDISPRNSVSLICSINAKCVVGFESRASSTHTSLRSFCLPRR